VLLPEKSHTIQYLPGPGARGLETTLEVGVFLLEPIDSLRIHFRSPGSSIDRLHSRLGLLRATPKRRELVAKMFYKLLQFFKRCDIRTFAV
jgi:hypothetical protein